ncbi:MAG: 3-hydroxyacyl-ACP dehydratase [Verrucomicrobiota bacterium]
MAEPKQYSGEEIANLLPHGVPFLFLDDAQVDGALVKASYLIRGDEEFLQGHFKGDPVFPGSIMFEALGQAGCLWILHDQGPVDQGQLLFVMLDGARCYKRAVPGDRLEMEVSATNCRPPLATFQGKILVNGEKIADVGRFRLAFGAEGSA